MAEEVAGASTESLFKAHKRRKVTRRRNVDEEWNEDSEGIQTNSAQGPEPSHDDGDEVLQIVRRPVAKKHGVAFASSGPTRKDADAGETALVPVQPGRVEEVITSDRFVKPTGKVVVEDKHLTAYVDSKLAELRSSTAAPTQDQDAGSTAATSNRPGAGLDPTGMTTEPSSGTSSNDIRKDQRRATIQNRQPKRRRQPARRDDTSLARDAMVDEIMRESEIPIYARTSTPANPPNPPSGPADDFDADEAAAQAFKAEFLANLQQRRRRKPPPPPPNSKAALQAAAASTGPKLGGSRSQRGKMKALEEAKHGAGKK
ncbi:Hypothetical predicted protein [Lecanosticta acicola]|uniref:Uncharacterized protein n=1 Tax=Lecanosticta acicola TaxID=111012 RepID=A0AAI9EDD4_9PEZI|nr:Hypothetical predicted protein [Lecanosticta acicola]